MENADKLMKFI